jgi:hypothetical protein
MPEEDSHVGDPDDLDTEIFPRWEQVIDDMTATAEEYRERGWDAHEIHPGDVARFAAETPEGRTGFELVAPGDEFDAAANAFDEADGFESAQVFRAGTSGTLYVVVVLESPQTETAVLMPMYYSPQEDEQFREMLEREDDVRIHVRPLNERRVLTFTHDDVSLFLPDE